jgi:uncharacterized HAD superfamily protein
VIKLNNKNVKICAIDIDGVLCEYPKAWLEYLVLYADYDDHRFRHDNKLPEAMNLYEWKNALSFEEYRHCKEEYRKSGAKRTIPAIEGASSLTKALRDNGYIIVLLTKRPFLKYKTLMADTLYWLRDNDIAYDLLFWGKDKHIQIAKYFPELEFIIEDNHSVANQVAEFGYKVFLLDNEYNREKTHKSVIRINHLKEVARDIGEVNGI